MIKRLRFTDRKVFGDVDSIKNAIANGEIGGGGLTQEQVENIVDGKMGSLVNPVTAGLTLSTPSGGIVEVGASTTPVLAWTIGNSSNAASAKIVETTNSNATIANLTVAASGTYTFPSAITENQAKAHSYRLDVTDKLGRVIPSSVRTINWYFGVYFGNSTNASLNESQIKALTKRLQASMATSSSSDYYNFTGTGYKYICVPASFSVINLFNASTGFAFPLIEVGTVNVTVNGITTSYRVLRTENQIGAVTVRS